jgi:hypothetical protein
MLPKAPLPHFDQVPEPKTIKNRGHLCLHPRPRGRRRSSAY